ncbi:hypothetical protein DH2020_029224 [Rehmannia glutinosa]|uniref:Uncharacterized protein n=1 Tax=Rehmannia glutinosa TaxID=99300 RepID=A0ABR0VP69_REHGL
MCNPNSVSDHKQPPSPPPPPPQCHLYLDLITVPTTLEFKHHEATTKQQIRNTNLPTPTEILTETKSLINLAFPIALTSLILYSLDAFHAIFGPPRPWNGASLFSSLWRSTSKASFFDPSEDLPSVSRHHSSPYPGFPRWDGFPLAHQFLARFSASARRGWRGGCFRRVNMIVLVALVLYIWVHGLHLPTWTKPSLKCLTGWAPLVRLAAPSCVSVCLEWWWYEIMIVLCGLLVDPKATVASMGVLIQTTSLLYVFPSSVGLAVSTRIGNELRANRPDKARVCAIVAIFIAGLMGLSAMTVVRAWELPQTVGCGVVRGQPRPSTAANVNLGAFYLVGMPVAIGLGSYLVLASAMRAQLLTCAGCGDTTLPRDGDGRRQRALDLR